MHISFIAALATTLAVVAAKNHSVHPHELAFKRCVTAHHNCTHGHSALHPMCQKTLTTCCSTVDKQCLAHTPKEMGHENCKTWKHECNKGHHVGPKKDKERQKCKPGDKECHHHTQTHSSQPAYTPPSHNPNPPKGGVPPMAARKPQSGGEGENNRVDDPKSGAKAGPGGTPWYIGNPRGVDTRIGIPMQPQQFVPKQPQRPVVNHKPTPEPSNLAWG